MIVEMGRNDKRIVAGAFVGSSATGMDRWSDIDIAFGFDKGVDREEILSDWTRQFQEESKAVHLFDLPHLSTIYRVFLFPGNLQVDISLTPGEEFGALTPRFSLIFGTAVKRTYNPPPSRELLFGLAVHHLVRARICVERGRLWEAEYLLSEARDQVLSIICLERGLPATYGRGFDALPAEIKKRFADVLISNLEKNELVRGLGTMVDLLIQYSAGVGEKVKILGPQLSELASTNLS